MTAIIGWALIVLCALGVGIAAWGWWFVTSQVRKDELIRQEVREALDYDIPAAFEVIVCAKHHTVSPDYCATCRIEELVEPRLRLGGTVVHSE